MNQQLSAADKFSGNITIGQEQIEAVLPKHVSFQHFQQVALTAYTSAKPFIRDGIAAADPQSLINALVKCASDGLLPDGGEAALIPYYDKEIKRKIVQYMPMIKGVYKAIEKTGKVKSKSVGVVYEDEEDRFEYDLGSDPFVRFKPKLNRTAQEDNNKVVLCAYATMTFVNGGTVVEIMDRQELEKVAACSKAPGGGVWRYWPDQMRKKAVFHRLAKANPLTPELDRMIVRDHDHYTFDRQEQQAAIEHKQQEDMPPAEKPVQHDYSKQIKKLDSAIGRIDVIDKAYQLMEKVQAWFEKIPENDRLPLYEKFMNQGIQVCASLGELTDLLSNFDPIIQSLTKKQFDSVTEYAAEKRTDLLQAPLEDDALPPEKEAANA